MTMSSPTETAISVSNVADGGQNETTTADEIPSWFMEKYGSWGERLNVAEWENCDNYRSKNGWKGQDLVHGKNAPVRILEYRVKYGSGEGTNGLKCGGVGTTLLGVALFTKYAESHKGYCHGGSMCSVMDDLIGWCAFLVTGECRPWTGFTVQVNTSLKRPIEVGSYLIVRAKIVKVERRKVHIEAELDDPRGNEEEELVDTLGESDLIHASAEGLVIINRGVLPE